MLRLALAVLLAVHLAPARAPLRLNELDELKNFYNTTGGASWSLNTNWDIGATSQCGWVDQAIPTGWPYVAPPVSQPLGPACIYKDPCSWNTKWHGVGCVDPCYAPTDGDNCVFGRVTMLDLTQNKVEGTIPPTFFDALINLTLVDLAYNSISGTIPTQVGKLRNVRRLELRNNNFVGSIPTQIANLGYALGYDDGEGTTHIDLAHGNLTGTVPSEIGYLEALKLLDLSNNPHLGLPVSDNPNLALNPPLPTELGLLTQLQSFNLDYSGFEGFVPTQIGQLSLLQHFFARSKIRPHDPNTNRISGTIPTEVGKLKKLHTLGLSSNVISGTLPAQIGEMDILRRLELEENQLSGTMPDVFGTLRHIEYWDTYGNSLSGDLPNSIMNASTLEALYIQIEQTGPLRNFQCGERIPGLGNSHNDMKVPSSQAGAKYNWVLQAADYFNMVYTTACVDTAPAEYAFQALSGDV